MTTMRTACIAFVVALVTVAVAGEDYIDFGRYHNYDAVEKLFRQLESSYPNLAKLHSIGKSVEQRNLWALHITDSVQDKPRRLGKPMFKWVANMHGNEAVGRQMVVYMAQYLLHEYGRDERVTKLVNATDLWLMPSLNPDGFERAREGNCYQVNGGGVGRANANNVDLNRNFPDQFHDGKTREDLLRGRQPETLAAMTWIVTEPFVLSGTCTMTLVRLRVLGN
jgi:carboxypeptidase D